MANHPHPHPGACIFCKIVKGEIPCLKVAENDKLLAFLDIFPANPGHIVVAVKEHHSTILDTPKELMDACFSMCQELSHLVKEKLICDGINIGMNNGPAAGQGVAHTHMHVIPRFNNDGLVAWPQKPYQQGQAEEILKRLLSK